MRRRGGSGKVEARPGDRGRAALGLGHGSQSLEVSEAQDARRRKGTIAELWGTGTGPNKIKRRALRAGRVA